tara:strand:+ start:4297 stop:4890 length:594 start_codon:yes stop_codon:yes gene_type:complete
MITPMNFFNMGYLMLELPSNLFNSLKKECKNGLKKNKKMISGLTSRGVPKHVYVENKKNLEELNVVLQKLIRVYRDSFTLDPSITKTLTNEVPLVMGKPWVNYQSKHEFVPSHTHDGIFSYTIWIEIPYNNEGEFASTFKFQYSDILGNARHANIKLNKQDSGKMLFFPSALSHQVYPFYSSDKYRISISGNLLLDT